MAPRGATFSPHFEQYTEGGEHPTIEHPVTVDVKGLNQEMKNDLLNTVRFYVAGIMLLTFSACALTLIASRAIYQIYKDPAHILNPAKYFPSLFPAPAPASVPLLNTSTDSDSDTSCSGDDNDIEIVSSSMGMSSSSSVNPIMVN